ncbi:AMP-binding protein [Prochlorococcus sp. MIT 1300]|uniref:AMP-binding protein n=1 Tax=Prochlorococcus sp. MIT 1300 TaxID=3096218 RepID=UPI002A7524ED|nr:AMP-binding protein [Prochlorococcus sp. MIT 1300]
MVGFARAFWSPDKQEEKALTSHHHVDQLDRIDQLWPWLSDKHSQVLAVQAPHAYHPESFSYGELSELISTAAASFYSLGIRHGEVVALFAENSPRWLIADQGLMRVGAADSVRGASSPVEELNYIIIDSKAKALIIQNAELLNKLSLTNTQMKEFKFILQLEGKSDRESILDWQSFLDAGIGLKAPDPFADRDHKSAEVTTATILYTSGTTGKPKGVPLTHANILHQMKSLACVAYPAVGSPVLSVLPIWHAYERSAEYYFFSCGCTQTYTTIKELKRDLPKIKPVVMATVPRLWEAIQIGFYDAIKALPPHRRWIIKKALSNSAAQRVSWRRTRGLTVEPISPINKLISFIEAVGRWPMHRLASLLLWPKVLEKLCGGQLRFPINGGGAIAPHVDVFFESLGVELLVGYGLTETSPVVSCRRPWRNIRGTSGPPLPKTEFKIVDPETRELRKYRERGLVLVRGPQVMNGYLGKPEETSKVLDRDGWFDTGDLGMLLPDGSLVLTGRAKDTIVLSSGENVEPSPLEEFLVASPLFDQVMMVGQDEKKLGALIVPNVPSILLWANNLGFSFPKDLGGSPGDPFVRKSLSQEINRLLAQRPSSRSEERVIGIALVDAFTIENGLLTQTLKQRRENISARDQFAIADIYSR